MRVGCVSRRWAAWVRVIRAQMATFLTRALAVDTEPEHVVRVLYAVPSDREFRADGREGIAHTVVDVQSWYRQKLGGVKHGEDRAVPGWGWPGGRCRFYLGAGLLGGEWDEWMLVGAVGVHDPDSVVPVVGDSGSVW